MRGEKGNLEHFSSAAQEKLVYGSSSSSRSHLAIPSLIINLVNQTGNDTFASAVCAGLPSSPSSIFVNALKNETRLFLLPDCFFDYGAFTYLALYNVIIQGNTTRSDPMDRLSSAGGQSISLVIVNSVLLPYGASLSSPASSATYTPTWGQIFTQFPSVTTMWVEKCNLIGSLPFSYPASISDFSLDDNPITGSIPDSLLSTLASAAGQWYFSAANTNLTGSIPEALLTVHDMSSISVNFSHNAGITGTIPYNLLNVGTGMQAITIDFSAMNLSGPLTQNLWGLPHGMQSLVSLDLRFASLGLTGTFPISWITPYTFPVLLSFNLNLDDSLISSDSVDSGFLPNSAPIMATYTLSVNNSPLKERFFSSFLDAILAFPITPPTNTKFSISLQNCGINGELDLPSPPSSVTNLPRISLLLSSNAITNFSAAENTSFYLAKLDLSGNSAMQGNMDNLFSSSSSVMTSLDLSGTAITGPMPSMALQNTSRLQTILMEGVNVDFCSGEQVRSTWSSSTLTSCSFLETNANQCTQLYPALCFVAPVAPTPMTPPVGPIFQTPPPALPSCSNATRPSLQFDCVNGSWVSTTSVTTPTLTIPSGAPQTVIVGDVESTSIVFTGLGSTLTITGCALNLTSITLTLTPEDLKGNSKIIQQLLNFGSSNCSNDNLDSVTVDSRIRGSTCRKVKATKTISNGQLSGIFTIDSSPCRTWWIILVSVIGGIVVLAVLILVLLVIFVPKIRYAVRPYSRPRDRAKAPPSSS